jgi:hypothetical protein
MVRPMTAGALAASATGDVGTGSPPLGMTLDSPSTEVEGEDESDMTSPPMLDPTALRRRLVTGMTEEQERDEFQKTTHLSCGERLLERP